MADQEAPQADPLGFLIGGGDVGALMRAHDWTMTPMGSPETWPTPLKSVLSAVLNSPILGAVLWGPELRMFFNDAYRPSLADRHPASLGRPVREVWGAAWDQVSAPFYEAMKTGAGFSKTDVELVITRHGQVETTYWDFSAAPIRGEDGVILGLLNQGMETTALYKARREMDVANARQRRQFEKAPGLICFLHGPDHVFDFVNDTHRRLFNSGDWVGKPAREAAADFAGQGFFEQLDQVRRTGERYVAKAAPVRFRQTPDGPWQERFLDFIYAPITEDDGEVTGIFCEGFDVTDVHRSQERFWESEKRLQALNADLERLVIERSTVGGQYWHMSPDLLGVLNPEAYFVHSNPAWLSVLGWSQDEVRSTSVFDLIHPDDVEATKGGFEHLKGGGSILHFENRYRHKDGSYRWIDWSASPLGDAYFCSGRDVTAEKDQAEALARRTEERDRLWETSQDLLVTVDLDGTFLAANPAWAAILGWDVSEVVGRNHLSFVHPDDHVKSEMALEDAAVGAIGPVAVRCRHKTEGWRWISWVASGGDGVVYASGRHVTAERQAADDLAAAQEALRQAQKMEAVGQLTGGIAHDFNNLLAGISGSLELLQKRLSEGRVVGVDRYIDAAQSSARRAAALTQRLLAFSRRQTLDPKPTDVNKLIFGMEDLIRRSVGPAIALEVVGAGGLWSTRVDPSQLENAILNLCINGRDAMAPDGGRLTIETANKWLDDRAAKARELPPGQYVSICVTDTGAGMTPEVIERAFEPFYTTKPLGQGTGLGLSMIYGFARQSGGQVRIYSELGKGTTLCLYLPRYVGRAAEDDEGPPASMGASEADGEVVLVVDDEDAIRMLVVEVVQELGYAVIEAPDGPSALKMLQGECRIDLLITDVGLPGGLNGRQIADAARQSRSDLKVLFITGYAENAVVGNGHLDPGMEIITKPFVMTALGAKIRDLIERSA